MATGGEEGAPTPSSYSPSGTAAGDKSTASPPCPHLSQIQPLLLMGRLQLLQLTWRVVEAWLRQLMARHVLSLITSFEMFQSWKRCSRSM